MLGRCNVCIPALLASSMLHASDLQEELRVLAHAWRKSWHALNEAGTSWCGRTFAVPGTRHLHFALSWWLVGPWYASQEGRNPQLRGQVPDAHPDSQGDAGSRIAFSTVDKSPKMQELRADAAAPVDRKGAIALSRQPGQESSFRSVSRSRGGQSSPGLSHMVGPQ